MPVIINSAKSSNKTYVDFGDIIKYEIVISNSGDTSVNNVFFIDTLPNEVYFTSNSIFINGINSPGYTPNIPLTLPNLNPSEAITISFEAAVNALFPISNSFSNLGNLIFSYAITSNNFRTSQVTNQETHFINKAILDVQKSTDDFIGLNYPLTTTIVIKNIGNIVAKNLILKEILDDGMSLGTSPIYENNIPITGDLLTGLSLTNLNSSSSNTISYTISVNSLPSLGYVETYNNLYYSYTVDPTTTLASTALTGSYYELTTVSSALLSTNFFVTPSVATLGSTVTYTLVLKNIGNSTGEYINLLDTLPTPLTFNPGSVFIDGVNYPSFNPNTGISIPNMISNSTRTITYTSILNSIPTPQLISNTAKVDFKSLIPNSIVLNSLSTITNLASLDTASTDLSLTKTSSSFFISSGLTFTYTFELKNNSSFPIFNAILYDTIPSGLAFIPNSVLINALPSQANPTQGILLSTIPQNEIITLSFNVIAN